LKQIDKGPHVFNYLMEIDMKFVSLLGFDSFMSWFILANVAAETTKSADVALGDIKHCKYGLCALRA
jgi:hypothetical protein